MSTSALPTDGATRRRARTLLWCGALTAGALAAFSGDGAPRSAEGGHPALAAATSSEALGGPDATRSDDEPPVLLDPDGRGARQPLRVPGAATTSATTGATSGAGAGTPSAASTPVSVPVLVQEALPVGESGVDRVGAVATFGLPFPQGQVQQIQGRPALSVAGSPIYQFTTLDTWPDGSVKWALCDVRADVTAGGKTLGLTVKKGLGSNSLVGLASDAPGAVQVDSGPLRLWLPKDHGGSVHPILYAKHVSAKLSAPAAPMWLLGRATNGDLLTTGHDTHVTLLHNGPARALLQIDGSLVDPSGAWAVDFTCYVTLRRGSSDLEVTVTIRDANIAHPQHVVLESVGLVLAGQVGAAPLASIARPTGTPALVQPLAPGDWCFAYQAHSSASAIYTDSPEYLPHIPKLPGSQVDYEQEGYQIQVAGNDVIPLGNRDAYPEHGWLDLSGQDGGVTMSILHMPYLWPAALEASGSGLLVAGVYTSRNSAPYTWMWRQHESRTAVFSFHKGHGGGVPDAAQLEAVALRLDLPLTGRAVDYKHYDQAGVFPYRLLTVAEQEQAYAWMGIPHTLQTSNDGYTEMRYIGKSFTGGTNNYSLNEDRLVARWLRHGQGGAYVKALDYSLWKAEWQIRRSDDHVYTTDVTATNEGIVPTTTRSFGDEEHRYREGLVESYWLTGDPRYRDALFDEVEVLKTVTNYQQERSMYQTLRAEALVAEFTHDDTLLDVLRQKAQWFCSPTVDILTETAGWGWESAPDLGDRRYYVNSADNKAEKPPGENFQCRGFITASLGPIGLYQAARALGVSTPIGALARGRMRDLSFWTRNELFPFVPDPANRHLPYSYAVTFQQVTEYETSDFHPILLGMAEAYVDTGDVTYLKRGVQQLEAFAAHDNGPHDDNLYLADTRPDCQHFFAVYRDWYLSQF
ncbi:MAG: hypothetical protein H6825_13525 [Planctomycetes bacterium]|nr:hypothetical protein [Planctomycetota bacterium]